MPIRVDRETDLNFALACNGYTSNGVYQPRLAESISSSFAARRITFFGPNSQDHFFKLNDAGFRRVQAVLSGEDSLDLIHNYRKINAEQAARLAFTLGGIARYYKASRARNQRVAEILQLLSNNPDDHQSITKVAGYIAKMTRLATPKSAEAVASAMSMYVISGGHRTNGELEGSVFRMADAVGQDPVEPKNTSQLGLSQLARLKIFWEGNGYQVTKQINRLQEPIAIFDELKFPTVGAEFHLPPNIVSKSPDIWQRLALANISQDQPGSPIQYSRRDKGVIEVRMNPSYYPVTVANWHALKRLVPELNHAYFTATVNRNNPSPEDNLSWDRDIYLLKTVRAVGMLTYAGIYSAVPPTSVQAEIPFGGVYLGQTVKLDNGQYNFTGLWAGGKGQHGQMGIYTGFGENLPILTKYLSMALADPDTFRSTGQEILSEITTLNDALLLTSGQRQQFFTALRSGVSKNPNLKRIVEAEARIKEVLNPAPQPPY